MVDDDKTIVLPSFCFPQLIKGGSASGKIIWKTTRHAFIFMSGIVFTCIVLVCIVIAPTVYRRVNSISPRLLDSSWDFTICADRMQIWAWYYLRITIMAAFVFFFCVRQVDSLRNKVIWINHRLRIWRHVWSSSKELKTQFCPFVPWCILRIHSIDFSSLAAWSRKLWVENPSSP